MRVWAIALAAVLGLTGPASAAPLDLKHVSAEATWVVHLDVDAMRASTFCQRAYAKLAAANKDLDPQLDKLRALIGTDLRKDLHGLTLYGRKIGRNEGVLVIQADVDQARLWSLVRLSPDHKTSAYGPRELHSWTDAKGKSDERPVAAAFHKPTLLVVTPTLDELKGALDVLDAKSPSLAGKESALAGAVPAGSVVVARATGLANAELPFKSPLVTESVMFSLSLGDHQGELFAEARLATRSPELALQVKEIVTGARAMAELHHSADPAVVKLLKRLKVSVADRTVSVEFRAPADEVWAVAERNWERIVPAPKTSPSRSGQEK